MVKPAKKQKSPASKGKKRTSAAQTKINETLDCLLELHKLQAVLLEQLRNDL